MARRKKKEEKTCCGGCSGKQEGEKNDEYTPEYAPGEIIVSYYWFPGRDIAEHFGKCMEYPLIGPWEPDDGQVYIHQVPPGQEHKACLEFVSYRKFVEWAEPRDIKMHNRGKTLDAVLEKVEELRADTLMPDRQYEESINEIIAYLVNLK